MSTHHRATPNRVRVHTDVRDKLRADTTAQELKRHARKALQRLAVYGLRCKWKATKGDNRDWKRVSLLGSHYYLWFCTKDDGGPYIAVREVREHDDHSLCTIGNALDYVDWPADVEPEERAITTTEQQKFVERAIQQRAKTVHVLQGTPGTGKTTALIETIIQHGGERVLVVVASPRLVRLYEEHLGLDGGPGLARSNQIVRVTTPEVLVGGLIGRDVRRPGHEVRAKFGQAIAKLRLAAAQLGSWSRRGDYAYDALRVKCWGAQPYDAATPAKSEFLQGKLDQRERLVVEKLGETDEEAFFGDLRAAREALSKIKPRRILRMAKVPDALGQFELIVVDEVQDLTEVEIDLILALQSHCKSDLILCGDEGQTIIPSGFGWARLNDLVSKNGRKPEPHSLGENLRNPEAIQKLLEDISGLYANVEKAARPRGAHAPRAVIRTEPTGGATEGNPESCIRCLVDDEAAFIGVVADLADRGADFAVIDLENTDGELPARLRASSARDFVLTPIDAKGLEFAVVFVLGMGTLLTDVRARVESEGAKAHGDIEATKEMRLDIDRLRVVSSRAVSLLVFVETSPSCDGLVAEYVAKKQSLDEVSARATEAAASPDQAVAGLLKRSSEWRFSRPASAWRVAKQALQLAKRENFLGSEIAEAYQCILETGWALLVDPASEHGQPSSDLAREAASAARESGLDALAEALARFGEQCGPGPKREEGDVLQLAFAVLAAVPHGEASAVVDHRLWVAQGLQPRRQALLQHLSALEAKGDCTLMHAAYPRLLEMLGQERNQVAERVTRALGNVIDAALKDGDYNTVLEAANRIGPDRDREAAVALAHLGRPGDAWERVRGRFFPELLGIMREKGQLEQALEVVKASPDHRSEAELLRWVLETAQRLAADRERLTLGEMAYFDLRAGVVEARLQMQREQERAADVGRKYESRLQALESREREAVDRQRAAEEWNKRVAEELNKKVVALESKAKERKAEVEELEGKAEASKTKIEELERAAKERKAEVEELEGKAEASKTEIEELERRAKERKTEIEELERRAKERKTEVEALARRVRDLNEQVGGLEKKMVAEPNRDAERRREAEARDAHDPRTLGLQHLPSVEPTRARWRWDGRAMSVQGITATCHIKLRPLLELLKLEGIVLDDLPSDCQAKMSLDQTLRVVEILRRHRMVA